MADQKKEEFSNPSGGQIIGFILKVLGGGIGALVIAGIGFFTYENWNFHRRVDRCNEGGVKECETLAQKHWYRFGDGDGFAEDMAKVTNPIAIPILEKQIKEDDLKYQQKKEQKAAELKTKQEEKEKIEAAKKERKEKVEAAKKEREAAEKKARFPRILDSELATCEFYIKQSLKDPRSYRKNNSLYQIKETGLIDFTAKNSFGGVVRKVFDCNSFTFRD